MNSIPFSFTNVYEGLAEAEGLARFEDDTLWLEFQTKDSFIGLIKSEIKRIPLRAADLDSAKLKHKLMYSYLSLRASSLGALEQFPNRKGAEVELSFKRKYRDEVESLVSAILLSISEAKLTRLDNQSKLLDE